MITTVVRTGLVTGVVLAGTLVAGTATASDNTTRQEVHFSPTDNVVATCSDGSDIGLGFDIVRNVHLTYDDSGEVVKEMRNVNFTGIFLNLATSERYTFQGTRIVTFDVAKDLFFGRGNFRTVTLPGAGVVLHSAGMQLGPLSDQLLYREAGPAIDEWVAGPAAVCSLFGLTA